MSGFTENSVKELAAEPGVCVRVFHFIAFNYCRFFSSPDDIKVNSESQSFFPHPLVYLPQFITFPRENDGKEREAQGVVQDMACPRKLF